MRNSLDISQVEFKTLLDKSTAIVLNQSKSAQNQKGYHNLSQNEVEKWFDEPLPKKGMDNLKLLDFIEKKVINTATGNMGPNMYAYVMAGGNQMGIIAEKLATTINQNPTKWHLSPSMSEIEKRVVQWASDMVDFGKEVGGVMVSGGSASNFDALTVARNIFFKEYDLKKNGVFHMKPFTVYCSEETHSWIDKSVQVLGIGTNQLRKIPTNNDYSIDLKNLKEQIERDINNGFCPFCIVGNAGTVNTGAIDNLFELNTIAKEHKMWFHIDGAYGALASAVESKKHLYKGLRLSDSIALDFHKWLYQPFEAGCLLVRNWRTLKDTYYNKASYLDTEVEKSDNRLDFNEHHFQVSRNAKAFKVWVSLKAYGFEKITEMIKKDIDLTDYLSEKIRESDDFKLIAPSHLAISCFQYTGNLTDEKAINQLNKKIIPALEEDGRVFITGTTLRNTYVIRACLINHRKTKESVDYLIKVIREVSKPVLLQLLTSSKEKAINNN